MGGREGSEGCRLTRMTHVQGRAHSESPLARAQNVSVLIGDFKYVFPYKGAQTFERIAKGAAN